MGNKNNKRKKIITKKTIHKDENKDFINTINMNNINITENIIEDYIKINSNSKPKNNNEAKRNLNNFNNSKSLKTFDNNTNEKSIKFYYNDKIKIIKYQDKFDVK